MSPKHVRTIGLACLLAFAPLALLGPPTLAAPAAKPSGSGSHEKETPGARAMRPTRILIGAPESVDVPGGSVAVPMDLSGAGIVVSVMLNGSGPYPFVLDPASPCHGRLDPALAKELGLSAIGDARAADASLHSASPVDLVRVDSLRVGGAVFRGLQMAAFAAPRPADQPTDRRGGLGFGVFRDVLLTLDYPDSQIVIAQGQLSAHDAHVTPLTGGGDVARTAIEVGNADLEALLIPGDERAFSLPAAVVDTLRTVGASWLSDTARTTNNVFDVRAIRLSGPLRVAGHRFDVTEASYADVFRGPTLGEGVLRNFAITFDQASRLVRFTRPSGERLEARAARTSGGR